MKNKYTKKMDSIQIDDQMKERLLMNIENKMSKNEKEKKKSKSLEIRKRYISVITSSAAMLVMICSVITFNNRYPSQKQTNNNERPQNIVMSMPPQAAPKVQKSSFETEIIKIEIKQDKEKYEITNKKQIVYIVQMLNNRKEIESTQKENFENAEKCIELTFFMEDKKEVVSLYQDGDKCYAKYQEQEPVQIPERLFESLKNYNN